MSRSNTFGAGLVILSLLSLGASNGWGAKPKSAKKSKTASALALRKDEFVVPQPKARPWKVKDSVCVEQAGGVLCGFVVRVNAREAVVRRDSPEGAPAPSGQIGDNESPAKPVASVPGRRALPRPTAKEKGRKDEITVEQPKGRPWGVKDSVCVNRGGSVLCGFVVRATPKQAVVRLDIQGTGIAVLAPPGKQDGRRRKVASVNSSEQAQVKWQNPLAGQVDPAPGTAVWDRVQFGPLMNLQSGCGATLTFEGAWVPAVGIARDLFVRGHLGISAGKNEVGSLFPKIDFTLGLGTVPFKWGSLIFAGGVQLWPGNGGVFPAADTTLLLNLVHLGWAKPTSSVIVPGQMGIGYGMLFSRLTTHQIRLQAVFALQGF